MTRNVIRILLIFAWLGLEAWLFLVSFGLAFARADSGVAGYAALGGGIGLLMLALFPGLLVCLVGGRRTLRVAAVIGVVLLGYGVGLVAAYHSVYENDVNRGAISLGILLPGALVLGGVGLMRHVAQRAAGPVPRD